MYAQLEPWRLPNKARLLDVLISPELALANESNVSGILSRGFRVGDSSPARIGSLLNRPWLYSKGDAPISPWVGVGPDSTSPLTLFWSLGLRLSMLTEALGFLSRK